MIYINDIYHANPDFIWCTWFSPAANLAAKLAAELLADLAAE